MTAIGAPPRQGAAIEGDCPPPLARLPQMLQALGPKHRRDHGAVLVIGLPEAFFRQIDKCVTAGHRGNPFDPGNGVRNAS